MSFVTDMFKRLSLLENTFLNEDIEGMKKFYPNIPADKFQSYIELDPTYKKGSTQAGKYAKWILGLANKSKLDNIGHVSDILKRFEDVKTTLKNKDIMTFKSIEELESMLNNQNSYNEKSNRQKLRDTQKAVSGSNLNTEASLVFEDNDWWIWVPKTYEASCKLGRGTTWCTASTESDYYFRDYSGQGPLYININKHDSSEKYQFHFESEQFMDKDDRAIDIFEFIFEEHKELLPFYNNIICRWLELEENSDLNEYQQVSYDSDDIYHLLQDTRNGDVDGDTIVKLITCPEELYGEWDFSYVEVTSELIDVLDVENKQNIQDRVGSLDLLDIESDMDTYGTILNAAQLAFETGSILEAHRDAVKALIKSVLDVGTGTYDSDNGDFTVTYIPYQVLKDYYSRYSQYFNNILKDSIANVIKDNYRLFEPQYGWNEFDENTFNAYIKDNL